MPSSQTIDLSHQVIVVTGAGRGLGRAYALASAAAGASVAVIARTPDQIDETVALIQQAGGRAAAFACDVTDHPAVGTVFHSIEQQFGPVDLLINNAGIAGPVGPIWEIDPDEWWHTLEVNFRGALLCSRSVLPGMLARRKGRIIHVTSDAGVFGIPFISAYGLSKTALIRLAEVIAQETAGRGVSVFALTPGTVRTGFTEEILSSESQKWIPWFTNIFERGLDVPADLSVQLILQLASGGYDNLSGRYLTIEDDLDQLLANSERIEQDSLYALRVDRLSEG